MKKKSFSKKVVSLFMAFCLIFGMVMSTCFFSQDVSAAPAVTMNDSSISIAVGTGHQLQLSRMQSSYTVTWETSNSKVCTVDSTGYVRGISVGTATVSAVIKLRGYMIQRIGCDVKVTPSTHSTVASINSTVTLP